MNGLTRPSNGLTTTAKSDIDFALTIRRALIMIATAVYARYGVSMFLLILKGEDTRTSTCQQSDNVPCAVRQ